MVPRPARSPIMRSASLALALLFAAAFAVLPAFAAPTAEEIVARYIDSLGGAQKVAAVQSIIIRGKYSEGDFNLDATLAKMRPYYKLVGDPLNRSKEFEEGYDGSAWEFYGDPGFVVRTVTAASEAGRHETAVLGALADYKSEGASVNLIGPAMIAGRKTWQIRLRLRDGFEEDDFLDAANGRLVASRKVAKVHAVGKDVASETRWSDFRTVDGITLPFLEREVEIATGKELNRFVKTSVTINAKLSPADFSPPDFKRTPEQTLIETLFVERDDAATLLWTLFDFRRAHPDVSTDLLCRIAGYQMVKTGQFKSAFALLEENAKTYPQSAAAASSLGRAYANGGETEKARAELTRALALDPSDKRAKAALDGLGK